jgi:predicted alpha-1,6-mannanase (GH76 family)
MLSRAVDEVPPGSTLIIRSGSYPAPPPIQKNLTLNEEGGPVCIGAVDAALMAWYDPTNGNWRKEHEDHWWWQSAHALTTLIDYMIRTGNRCNARVVAYTYDKNKGKDYTTFHPGHDEDFNNFYIDDSGWWGLAWIRAYDLTSESRYLDAAGKVADWMWVRGKGWDTSEDNKCGGGLWWQAEPPPADYKPDPNHPGEERRTKNAITIELFIKLAASLHNRLPGDTEYLRQAQVVWNWFNTNAMMAPLNQRSPTNRPLILDSLYDEKPDDHGIVDTNCNDARFIWSYSQGAILGALVELYRATGDAKLLDEADGIANAAIDSARTNYLQRMVYPQGSPHEGILRELGEEEKHCSNPNAGDCDINSTNNAAATFKGVFVRNLRELYDQNKALGRSTYTWASFLKKQRESVIANARTATGDFGFFWTGPIREVTFATTASGLDALNAALGL